MNFLEIFNDRSIPASKVTYCSDMEAHFIVSSAVLWKIFASERKYVGRGDKETDKQERSSL